MPDIYHLFPVHAPVASVYDAVSTPAGLISWWAVTCSGVPVTDGVYEFGFGPEYQWKVRVTRCEKDAAIEWEFVTAMDDWMGTRVGFELRDAGEGTEVAFHHTGWAEATPHFRTSSFCWAMYLRLLKRFVEFGEVVTYEDRLES